MPLAPPFPLPPELTQIILGGSSAIDLEGLNLSSRETARQFAIHYGYDLEVPSQRHHAVRVFEDALDFTRDIIEEKPELRIPPEIEELEDLHQLLIWASERPKGRLGAWSCVLLRVMHTLFHVDHNINLKNLPEIQRQVFGKYDPFIHQDSKGQCWLEGDYRVPLVAVHKKEKKDRNSILVKLLHKPENVAESIYDRIGIRFVAEDQLGVLLVVRFLLDHLICLPTDIKPDRTRNRMIDPVALQAWMESLPDRFQIRDLSVEERRSICNRLALVSGPDEANPFSSNEYSALQFTIRTLIRLPSPAVHALILLQHRFEELGRPEMSDLLHIPELIQDEEELTFFFAHEVQVMERQGFEKIQSGPASHWEYKLRKREVAIKRVLQGIL